MPSKRPKKPADDFPSKRSRVEETTDVSAVKTFSSYFQFLEISLEISLQFPSHFTKKNFKMLKIFLEIFESIIFESFLRD